MGFVVSFSKLPRGVRERMGIERKAITVRLTAENERLIEQLREYHGPLDLTPSDLTNFALKLLRMAIATGRIDLQHEALQVLNRNYRLGNQEPLPTLQPLQAKTNDANERKLA